MTADPTPQETPEATRIHQTLAHYRQDLYGGRGPGISESEWLANTSLRPSVGGVPTATSRQELHLRTLRARGEEARARRESEWAVAQFRPAAGHTSPQPVAHQPARPDAVERSGTARRPRKDKAGWARRMWSWLRDGRRRDEDETSTRGAQRSGG